MPVRVLPPEIQQRIAAGEVIDRPAAAVKELIENALDAGARAISVEVRDGGLGLIRVSDDGSGMSRTDAALSLERFSTSKISTLDDLEQIHTLGFRGEALNSMAAVAQVDILTRAEGELEGTRIQAREGQTAVEPAASPVGASVTVSNLFGRLPARRRFLKSHIHEGELIQQAVARYALAYPQVAFRLVIDGRERLIAPPDTPLGRIGAVLGREVAGDMIAIEWQALDLHVHGYISRPTLARSRRSDQHFWVNGRPVRSGLLAVMLERPYAGRLPPGRYPLCALHIEIDPHHVDINVHPQKAEVRFAQERAVYGAVSSAVTQALREFPQQTWTSLWMHGEQSGMAWPFSDANTTEALAETPSAYAAAYAVDRLRALAQLHRLYILAQSEDGLIIADQHAAHEQVLFECLLRGSEPTLLSPSARLGLAPSEIDTLGQIAPILAELGIEVENLGGPHLLIRTLPAALKGQNAAELLTALIEEAQRCSKTDRDLREALAMKAACLGAVKAGDELTIAQMQQLLDDLIQAWSPATCPHGRPALASISMQELNRRFGRT